MTVRRILSSVILSCLMIKLLPDVFMISLITYFINTTSLGNHVLNHIDQFIANRTKIPCLFVFKSGKQCKMRGMDKYNGYCKKHMNNMNEIKPNLQTTLLSTMISSLPYVNNISNVFQNTKEHDVIYV